MNYCVGYFLLGTDIWRTELETIALRIFSDRNERVQVVGEEQEVIALNTYSVENVPYIVTVSLKRFDEMLNKMDSDVRFPPDINLHKYSSRAEWRGSPVMHSVPWHLHSVVCHRCVLPCVHIQVLVVECSRMLCWLVCRIPWRILCYNERTRRLLIALLVNFEPHT